MKINIHLWPSNVYWTVHHCNSWRMKDQLDVTCYFISLLMVRIWWCSFCRLQPTKRTPPNTNRNKSSNTQRTENKTTDVVIHQHSRKLLKMDILMSEKCWAHNKWNKIASDIKLVFLSSTIAMMHGPINIRVIITIRSLQNECGRKLRPSKNNYLVRGIISN